MPAATTASRQEGQSSLTIRQGRIDLSFHQVVGEVFASVLTDPRLFLSKDDKASDSAQVSVTVTSAPHADAFETLRRGDSDILVGWFDGSHGTYIEPFRNDVVILGDKRQTDLPASPAVYNPYCIWAVPDYVPEALVPDVGSLADPTVSARFPADAQTGKRVLQGIAPGAGISRFSVEMVDKYNLAGQGWEFKSGTQEECFGNVESKIAKEEWFVVPLWHPQYLHAQHKLRALKEPQGLLRPVDEARLVLRKEFLASLTPTQREALLRVTGRVSLRNDAVTQMDKYVHVDRLSYKDAARRWIRENRARFDSWFEGGHVDIVQRAAEAHAYTIKDEQALKALPILSIPAQAPPAAGAYSAFSISSAGLIHTSFQLPWDMVNVTPGGAPKLAQVGPVTSATEAQGLFAVRVCALNLLAQLRDAAGGDLARVQLLRLEGYVATKETEQDPVNVPRVLDAASVLIKHALGAEQGAHARTALIFNKNPLDVPTMLGAVAELRW